MPACEVISTVRFSLHSAAKQYPTAKVFQEVNRKLPAKNMTVQLLTLYTDPEQHNSQHYRQTDDIMLPRKYTHRITVECQRTNDWEKIKW